MTAADIVSFPAPVVGTRATDPWVIAAARACTTFGSPARAPAALTSNRLAPHIGVCLGSAAGVVLLATSRSGTLDEGRR
jgi:hypothetical protein